MTYEEVLEYYKENETSIDNDSSIEAKELRKAYRDNLSYESIYSMFALATALKTYLKQLENVA